MLRSNLLQYSCLENSMDRGAWWATVHGVTESWTRLGDWAHMHAMLPKAHLTSHSKMSGSGWVTTPSWLSRSLRPFLYSSSVYYCHLFLISSASVINRSLLLLSFILPILAWNVPLMSLIFLKRSLVFSILLFSSIYLHCSFKKAFLSLLVILWNSAFCWVYPSRPAWPFTSPVPIT